MVYWKYKFKFGKTTEDGIKELQDYNYNIKSISHFYYVLLCFIKWLFGLIFMPVYILFYMIYILGSILALLFDIVSELLYDNLYK